MTVIIYTYSNAILFPENGLRQAEMSDFEEKWSRKLSRP